MPTSDRPGLRLRGAALGAISAACAIVGAGLLVASILIQVELDRGVVAPSTGVEDEQLYYERINRLYFLANSLRILAPPFLIVASTALTVLLVVLARGWAPRGGAVDEDVMA